MKSSGYQYGYSTTRGGSRGKLKLLEINEEPDYFGVNTRKNREWSSKNTMTQKHSDCVSRDMKLEIKHNPNELASNTSTAKTMIPKSKVFKGMCG